MRSKYFLLLLALSMPLFGQLTHSRWNPNVSGIFQCCPTDTLRINVVLKNDATVPSAGPGTYTVYLNGVAQGGGILQLDGTFAVSDLGKPRSRTVSIGGLAGMDSTFQQFDGDFTYTVTVLDQNGNPPPGFSPRTFTRRNSFVWDYRYSIFLPTLVTVFYHTPIEFIEEVPVDLTGLKPQNPDDLCPCTVLGKSEGMAGYSFSPMIGGVTISDTPIRYVPPRGEPVMFAVTYNQRDSNQPTSFMQSNLGPKWTFNWLTYISAGPITGQNEAVRYLPGGGQERYQNFTPYSLNPSGGINGRINISNPHQTTRAVLWATVTASAPRPDFYELHLADGSVETYDNNAGGGTILYITKRVDPQGNTTTWNYAPASAQLLSITNALGQQTTFSYDLPGDGLKITKVTDPFGRFATFTYDAAGRLTSIADPVGIVSSFGYQGATDFITSLTTPYGTTTFASQEGTAFRIVQATDPLGQTERLEYRASTSAVPSQEAAIPSATGLTINNANLDLYNSFYWDKQAHAAAVAAGATPGTAASYAYARIRHWALGPQGVTGIVSSEKKPLESRVWRNYQGQPNPDYIDPAATALASVTARLLDDGSPQVSRKTYTANGYVAQSIDPVGRETDYVYAANGQDLVQSTQKNGGSNEQLFAATYNAIHLPLTTTDAAGQTTTTTYNAFGQPLTITNPKGEITTIVYDTSGFLQSTTGAIAGSTTSFTYDSAGRVRTVTDSEGYGVTNDYDNIDRLIKQTFPDSTFRQTVYDRLSVGSTRDRLSRTMIYTNDALGRVTRIQDPLGRIVNQTWCRCGSLKTLQDGNGNVTTWNYDLQGRLISKVYADGKGDSFLYETSTSRLKSKTDALGQTISYGYAKDDNLLSITYTSAKNPTPNVSFTYDPVYNRRTSMIDGTGTTTYGYYPVTGAIGAGRLQSATGPLTNSTISYNYDQLGRVVSRSINGAANSTSMTFDPLGRVTSETNGLGPFTTAYVNQTSRPSSLTYPNGQTTFYSYFDNAGDQRLKQLKNFGAGSVLLSQFDYTYDAEGQITAWGQQTAAANTYTLGYDPAGQLTTAALAGATPKSFIYGYDPAGNRTNETITGAANPVTVNPLNELVSRTGANPRAFAYDANGNMVSNNGTSRTSTNYTYLWDAENRLVAINYPTTNQRTEFTYDGLGRRVKIAEKTGSVLNATRQFVWDGLSMAEERDGANTLTKRFYSQGQINGATSLFYTRDHLGSVREVLNGAGALEARYDHDPYGRRPLLSGADVADFGFTGHFYHPQSKLHLAPYRTYDADSARWLSRDPLQEYADANLFSYVGGLVTSRLDPLGLKQCCVNEAVVLFGLSTKSVESSLTALGLAKAGNLIGLGESTVGIPLFIQSVLGLELVAMSNIAAGASAPLNFGASYELSLLKSQLVQIGDAADSLATCKNRNASDSCCDFSDANRLVSAAKGNVRLAQSYLNQLPKGLIAKLLF